MNYEFLAEEKQGFVHVKVKGENSPDNVRGYLHEVYELCARTGASSVLIEENLRGPRLDPVEVYRIIVSASADTLPVILWIASLVFGAGVGGAALRELEAGRDGRARASLERHQAVVRQFTRTLRSGSRESCHSRKPLKHGLVCEGLMKCTST